MQKIILLNYVYKSRNLEVFTQACMFKLCSCKPFTLIGAKCPFRVKIVFPKIMGKTTVKSYV